MVSIVRDHARAGSRVAYVGKSAPEFFGLLFGAAKIGAVTVPGNWRLTPPTSAGARRSRPSWCSRRGPC